MCRDLDVRETSWLPVGSTSATLWIETGAGFVSADVDSSTPVDQKIVITLKDGDKNLCRSSNVGDHKVSVEDDACGFYKGWKTDNHRSLICYPVSRSTIY